MKFFRKLKQFLSFHFLIRYKLNRFVKGEIQNVEFGTMIDVVFLKQSKPCGK